MTNLVEKYQAGDRVKIRSIESMTKVGYYAYGKSIIFPPEGKGSQFFTIGMEKEMIEKFSDRIVIINLFVNSFTYKMEGLHSFYEDWMIEGRVTDLEDNVINSRFELLDL